MTTTQNKAAEPHPPANAPGDNRGAEDVDGNKAGAAAGNKAKGPDAPEAEAESKDKDRNPPS
ncbi:MAG: hypothetical protein Q8T13_20450 [Acidobacteriota bacterium]|nr:hypothetical protein [Acidobacteriota bacterium]